MPEQETLKRARRDKAAGKSASTQAGEFVREEIHHVREGKHGARSTKQVIAIGLSKARRAGVRLSAPPKSAGKEARRQAARGRARAASTRRPSSPRRARAARRALKLYGRGAASSAALARQARSSARKRSPRDRSTAARRAARTRRSSP